MIVGDLNSGKSTLVNAIIRDKIVPMDQQPCTNSFIEIINSKTKEIQLISHQEESRHEIDELLNLNTIENTWIKVFHPLRLEKISIIDSPGLNIDTWTSLKVLEKHEEIDVLLYVVSAENHLTLSGKEFLENATKEKFHVFLIINRFDVVKDQEKCRLEITKQIQEQVPNICKSNEFIHFISAKDVLESRDSNLSRNFYRMEECLLEFIKKRNQSKLLPAKNFLKNLFVGLRNSTNEKILGLKLEKSDLGNKISQIHPQYVKMALLKSQFLDSLDCKIEEIAKSVQIYTKNSLQELLQDYELLFESVEFEGWLYTWYYANRLCGLSGRLSRNRIIHCLSHAKQSCLKYIDPVYTGTSKLIPEISLKVDSVFIDETLTSVDITIPDINLNYSDVLALDQVGTIFFPLVGLCTAGVYTLKDSITYSGILGSAKTVVFSTSLAGVAMFLFLALHDVKGRLQRKIKERISVEYSQSRFIEDAADNIAMKTRKVLRSSLWNLQAQYTTCYARNTSLLETLKNKHTVIETDLAAYHHFISEISLLESKLDDVILDH